MVDVAKASSAQLLIAPVVTPGTAPTTGWRTQQPNPSGIQNFQQTLTKVARDPLSPYMTDEKGAIVQRGIAPTLVHDLNKDWIDTFGPGLLRSAGKVPGNQGVKLYYPTAAADGGGSNDSYTVAADGDLPDGTLVYARGFRLAANNGVKVLAGTSTTTAIKTATATLAAETVSVAGSVSVEPCGFEFTAADLAMDASGNLTTVTKDCTTLNLYDGQLLFIGGTATGERLATVPLGTFAYVNGTVTTNLIPLRGHATVVIDGQPTAFSVGADTGTGKTVRIFYGVYYRNVADGHADYLTFPCWMTELTDVIGATPTHDYAKELGINTVTIPLGVGAKIEATLAMIGDPGDINVATGSRAPGPSTALPPLATDAIVTTCEGLIVHRILDAATGAVVVRSVLSTTLSIEHGAVAREALGSCGPEAIDFGKIRLSLSAMQAYMPDKAGPVAISANTTCRYEAILRNGQCGIAIEMTGTLGGGMRTYADGPVMQDLTFTAHRDPTSNRVMGISVLPYLPI